MAPVVAYTECYRVRIMKVNMMKNIFVKLMFLSMSFCACNLYADDTDIYIYSDETSANPPFFMLMMDYAPSLGSSHCGSLAACRDEMTEASFVQLCAHRAIITPINGPDPEWVDPGDGSSAPIVHRPDLEEQLCSTWYKDTINGGAADGIY